MIEQLALLAAVGWVVAAFTVGLWLGERGRRIAAENWTTTGSPDAPRAESFAPSKEAEDRFQEAGAAYTEEMVENGVKELMAQAKAEGVRVDEDQIRKDVKAMLSGEDVGG